MDDKNRQQNKTRCLLYLNKHSNTRINCAITRTFIISSLLLRHPGPATQTIMRINSGYNGIVKGGSYFDIHKKTNSSAVPPK